MNSTAASKAKDSNFRLACNSGANATRESLGRFGQFLNRADIHWQMYMLVDTAPVF
jgi:hypothetical protein